MALSFLREDPLGTLSETATATSCKKTRVKKFSKAKFSALLAANLILWLCVSGFYLEISPASIRESMREFSRRRGMVVTGVVCNSKMQAAIISDEVYEVGDTIKGYTIAAINEQGVELMKRNKKVFKKVTYN